MKQYPNFYETIEEAKIRLYKTIVMYDGRPYQVHDITNHKPDGILRLYLLPLWLENRGDIPEGETIRYTKGEPAVGPFLDAWMEANPDRPMLRKHINSPLFNKFRPFPIGMVNSKAKVFYVERQPTRRTEQGLTSAGLVIKRVYLGDESEPSGKKVSFKPQALQDALDLLSKDFEEALLGRYPSASECLSNLLDSEIMNNAGAFNRKFALVRGPIGIIFVAYKSDIIGVLPSNSLSRLIIGRDYAYLREAVGDLGVFSEIDIQL